MEVSVKTVEFVVRTTKLTRSLLKQFRHVRTLPAEKYLTAEGNIKPEMAVCWVAGSVLGEEYGQWVILKTDIEGIYLRFHSLDPRFVKGIKQVYVV